MMGIMCNDEDNYVTKLCQGIFDNNELNEIRKNIRGDN